MGATSVLFTRSTNSTRLLSTMDTTARRQNAGATNCTKPASGAGENGSYGGMSMIIAGTTLATGMITITISAVRLPAPICEPREATCQKIVHEIAKAELLGSSL